MKKYIIIILAVIFSVDFIFSQQWNVVQSPNPSTAGDYFTAVNAISQNDVWAVGAKDTIIPNQQLSRTLSEHWDGVSWSPVQSPSPGSQYNILNAVYGFASNNVYAAGDYAGIPSVPQMLVIHWNGSSWSQMATPVITGGSSLNCLLAFGPNDIYAGGSKDIGAPGPDVGTLVAHFNGSSWDTLTTPNQSNRINVITDMKGLSAGDIWAVGYTKQVPTPFTAMMIHKTGSSWNLQSIPLAGLESFLYSIDIINSNDIWASGKYNDNGILKPLFMHYNGSAWSVVNSPAGGYGIVHNSAGDIWSVGSAFAHFDGGSWSAVNTPIPATGILRSTSRINSGNIWAAGEYVNGGIRNTLIMHFGSTTGINNTSGEIPGDFLLMQNYPNPFNPETIIQFSLAKSEELSLNIYDAAGRKVEQLINGFREAGSYNIKWNASKFSSGIYFYSLTTAAGTDTRKMMLVK